MHLPRITSSNKSWLFPKTVMLLSKIQRLDTIRGKKVIEWAECVFLCVMCNYFLSLHFPIRLERAIKKLLQPNWKWWSSKLLSEVQESWRGDNWKWQSTVWAGSLHREDSHILILQRFLFDLWWVTRRELAVLLKDTLTGKPSGNRPLQSMGIYCQPSKCVCELCVIHL